MTEKPIRILHIIYALNRAGAETMLMNYFRGIDRSKIEFDFLTLDNSSPEKLYDYEEEIISLGGKVYRRPKESGPLSYFRGLYLFFKKHKEYKIIHSHVSTNSFIPVLAAMLNGVPVRIVHSHNTFFLRDLPFKTKITKPLIKYIATDYMACGEKSGFYLFGENRFKKHGNILNNAIDSTKYAFNAAVRSKIRTELGCTNDNIIIGNVARFCKEKDHHFLLEIFAEILKLQKDAVLLLVGDGPLKQEIEEASRQFGKSVIFTGNVPNVNEYMQAMEAFVLPSKYEGLPVTLIEAQAAGLKCYASKDSVPQECNIIGLVTFISKQQSPSVWADRILEDVHYERVDTSKQIIKAGYDIKASADKLAKFYIDSRP